MQEFVISSMSCGGCASRITQAIKNLDANAQIEVNLQKKTVRVDSSQEGASVVAALTAAGYTPVKVGVGAGGAATGAEKARSGCCCG